MHPPAPDVSRPSSLRGRAERRIWTHAPEWLSVAAIPLISLGVLLAAEGRWLELSPGAAATRTRLVGLMWLTEAGLLVVVAPLSGLFTAMRVWPSPDDRAGRSRAASLLVGASRLGLPLGARVALMVALSAALSAAMRTTMDASTMLSAHAILAAAALALATLGAGCARLFREPLDAAACATCVALLTGFAVFASGPVLDDLPRWVLEAALAVNPVVATASSAGIDIFRMDLLYQLSPLAHRQVEYPEFSTTFGAYVLSASAWLVLSARPFISR